MSTIEGAEDMEPLLSNEPGLRLIELAFFQRLVALAQQSIDSPDALLDLSETGGLDGLSGDLGMEAEASLLSFEEADALSNNARLLKRFVFKAPKGPAKTPVKTADLLLNTQVLPGAIEDVKAAMKLFRRQKIEVELGVQIFNQKTTHRKLSRQKRRGRVEVEPRVRVFKQETTHQKLSERLSEFDSLAYWVANRLRRITNSPLLHIQTQSERELVDQKLGTMTKALSQIEALGLPRSKLAQLRQKTRALQSMRDGVFHDLRLPTLKQVSSKRRSNTGKAVSFPVKRTVLK